MCIIIYIPTGIQPPTKEVLKHCWEQNPDNTGFMYNTPYNLKVKKFNNFEDFYRSFKASFDLFGDSSPFVIHMRYATHGTVSFVNTHPFSINKTSAFVHNGIIRQEVPDKENKENTSDSRNFGKNVLKYLAKEDLNNLATQLLLESYIGASSKVVILNQDNTVLILNEHKGTWEGGIWYSNDYYKTERKKITDFKISYGWSSGYISESHKHTCALCGIKEDSKETYSLLIKNGDHREIRRGDICTECFTSFILVQDLVDLISYNDCTRCQTRFPEKYSIRPEYYCITITNKEYRFDVLDWKCTFNEFKTKDHSVVMGGICVFIDPKTFEFTL